MGAESPSGDVLPVFSDEMSEIQSRTCSRASSRPVNRTCSRVPSRPGPEANEDAASCRLAQVVELMDHTECRQLLAPFDYAFDSEFGCESGTAETSGRTGDLGGGSQEAAGSDVQPNASNDIIA